MPFLARSSRSLAMRSLIPDRQTTLSANRPISSFDSMVSTSSSQSGRFLSCTVDRYPPMKKSDRFSVAWVQADKIELQSFMSSARPSNTPNSKPFLASSVTSHASSGSSSAGSSEAVLASSINSGFAPSRNSPSAVKWSSTSFMPA
ncbi:hypothetical protein D3C71_1564330 [compost metagenome]